MERIMWVDGVRVERVRVFGSFAGGLNCWKLGVFSDGAWALSAGDGRCDVEIGLGRLRKGVSELIVGLVFRCCR